MVSLSKGTFRFVLQTPYGTLIDCRSGSLIFPAHDGLQGVLRNHAPMLCKLSLGMIQVKDISGRDDAFFVINGGFARINENFITVLAHDVTTFEDMDIKEAEELLAKAHSHLAGGAYISTQTGETFDPEKARLIVKMGEMADIKSQ